MHSDKGTYKPYLGKGTYGTVVADGACAVKTFKRLRPLINEVFVTKYISFFDNFIKLKKCDLAKLTMTTVRWHCSLDTALSRKMMTAENKLSVHKCILRGLAFLEHIHIVHADIKTSNVFVNYNYDIAVLGDFGISSSSDSAKVDGTAPAFTLGKGRARSHRTHDSFSFVLLSLELLYGYDVRTLFNNRAELRTVIHRVVRDNKMRDTLCALVQDKETSSWTCRRALTELYGETVESPVLKAIDYGDNTVDRAAIKRYLLELKDKYLIRKVPRCERCTWSLLSLLDVPAAKVKLYSATMAFIFGCLFGVDKKSTRAETAARITELDVMAYAKCSREDVIVALNTIIKRDDVIQYIFIP